MKDRLVQIGDKAIQAKDYLAKNKTKLIVGTGIIVGNALGGGIIYEQNARIGELEKRSTVMEKVTQELINQDILTTGALCGLDGEMNNAPIEVIKEVCDQVEQQQLDYWRGVIETAKGKTTE